MHYLLILILSLFVNYLIALKIYKNKILLIIGLLFNLSLLFVFKYFDFILFIFKYYNDNINIKELNLVLPIGISFYTFQIISYTVDVYTGKIVPEKNFINISTYIIMFPQLIAGPIVRFNDVKKEIDSVRENKFSNLIEGIRVFVLGLGSKVIIANELSKVIIDIDKYGIENAKGLTLWVSAFSYAFQLYFDFFGYSLMAIGLAKMMGITIMKNFDNPYSSKSISEFWRRWHISLGTFLRDYIYIPLGGSRCGLIRTLINLFIVFLISGIWHGAAVNFVIWGIYFGVFIIVERVLKTIFRDNAFIQNVKNNIFVAFIRHILTIFIVVFSFVIFSHEDIDELIIFIRGLSNVGINDYLIDVIKMNYKVMIIAILFLTPLPKLVYNIIAKNRLINLLVITTIFVLSMFLIYVGLNDPFMYFRF